jgi:DNA-directed RNA polymerase subunit delta
MAPKSDKSKKAGKNNPVPDNSSSKKESSKPKKEAEEDVEEELDEEVDEIPSPGKKAGKPAASSKKKKEGDDEEEDAAPDEVDEWEKVEEEEEWDPDFDEFDIPKSKGKKAATGTKKPVEEEDFKIDDEFKDMFGDENSFDEEEDDY